MNINLDSVLRIFFTYILTPFIGFLLVAYVNGFASKAEVESLRSKLEMMDNKIDKVDGKVDMLLNARLK